MYAYVFPGIRVYVLHKLLGFLGKSDLISLQSLWESLWEVKIISFSSSYVSQLQFSQWIMNFCNTACIPTTQVNEKQIFTGIVMSCSVFVILKTSNLLVPGVS